MNELEEKAPNFHGISIIKNDKVIASGMKAPYDSKTPRILHSVSKSFTGMAIGLLITDGIINLDDKLLDYYRDKLPKGYDKRLEKLTIRDMLRFNAGDVAYSSYFIGEQRDWVELYLGATLPGDPGTGFHYDGGGSYVLSSLVNKLCGMSAYELLNQRIFLPLGIHNSNWIESPQQVSSGGWGLYLCLDDLVKISKLWMHYGNWEGKQLISESYMKESTKWQTETNYPGLMGHYGFQFWIADNFFCANGSYGQLVFVCPENNTACVMLSDASQKTPDELFNILSIVNKYLFVESCEDVLPDDFEAQEKLKNLMASLCIKFPDGSADNNIFEKNIFDRYISLKDNVRGIRGLYFERIEEEAIRISFAFRDRTISMVAGHEKWIETITPRAGIRVCFEDEALVHINHCLSYAFEDDKLIIIDCMKQSNNQDTYIFKLSDEGDLEENNIKVSGTVQVSNLLGVDNSPEYLIEK
ncbi:serine hydrolase domain-containing protein [Terrisporobacter sp.]